MQRRLRALLRTRLRNSLGVASHSDSGYTLYWQGGSSSVVECFLAKEDVAGSTPVSRSKNTPLLRYTPQVNFCVLHNELSVCRLQGAVPKW